MFNSVQIPGKYKDTEQKVQHGTMRFLRSGSFLKGTVVTGWSQEHGGGQAFRGMWGGKQDLYDDMAQKESD